MGETSTHALADKIELNATVHSIGISAHLCLYADRKPPIMSGLQLPPTTNSH